MSTNTFGRPIIPASETERLRALARYELLETPPEGAFNHIAEMAARLFHVPIALINLVSDDTVWTKASAGDIPSGTHVPRGVSLCSLAVLEDAPTVFRDARQEACLLANPMVAGELGLRFYAAAPLRTPEGHNIGALCLVDKQPRHFTEGEQKVLQGLAQIVMEEIESRYNSLQP